MRQISMWYQLDDQKVEKFKLNMARDLEPPTLESPTLEHHLVAPDHVTMKLYALHVYVGHCSQEFKLALYALHGHDSAQTFSFLTQCLVEYDT